MPRERSGSRWLQVVTTATSQSAPRLLGLVTCSNIPRRPKTIRRNCSGQQFIGAIAMRWTGWILAAMTVGCAGMASGQPCCQECGAYSMGWGPLSGEACCSPPGFSLSAWRGPCCCCANQQPCCNNAWDGYCAHHARAQAFWAQVGVPKGRGSCACATPRMPAGGCVTCSGGSAPTSQPMTPPAVVAPAAGTPPATSLAPAAGPSKEAPMPSLGPNSGSPSARPVPPPPPIPDSSHQTPKPSAMPSSVSPGDLPTPPDEAFRGVGQPWLR